MESEVQTFLERLAETLEVPSVSLDDDFRSVPMWSSLVGFAVMVMFELEYEKPLSVSDLKQAATVRDLAKLAGISLDQL